jgi:hypothetical protein
VLAHCKPAVMPVRGAARAVSAVARPTAAGNSKPADGRKAARKAQQVKERLARMQSMAHVDRSIPKDGERSRPLYIALVSFCALKMPEAGEAPCDFLGPLHVSQAVCMPCGLHGAATVLARVFK